MANIENFKTIIHDFTIDLTTTFPEFSHFWSKWTDATTEEYETLFAYCLTVFPERFFDILYKNAELFLDESEHNTEFLPGIVFKQLWNLDISDNTKVLNAVNDDKTTAP